MRRRAPGVEPSCLLRNRMALSNGLELKNPVRSEASSSEGASYRQGRRKTLNQPAFRRLILLAAGAWPRPLPAVFVVPGGRYDGLWRVAPGSRDTAVPFD